MKRVPIILGLMVMASMAWGQLMFQPQHIAGLDTAFTPASISGLSFWLRPDAGRTMNGTNVSAWADQSGNGINWQQTTASKQPEYRTNQVNGLPMLHFASGQSIKTVLRQNFAIITNQTIFIVLKPLAKASQVTESTIFAANDYNTDAQLKGFVAAYSAALPGLRTSGNCTLTYQNAGTWDADGNTTYITTWRVDSYAAAVWTNSAFMGSNAITIVSAPSNAIARISGHYDTYDCRGLYGDIIYYSRTLSDSERAQVEAYLKTRWGL